MSDESDSNDTDPVLLAVIVFIESLENLVEGLIKYKIGRLCADWQSLVDR